jgi:hypothetical protein
MDNSETIYTRNYQQEERLRGLSMEDLNIINRALLHYTCKDQTEPDMDKFIEFSTSFYNVFKSRTPIF